MIANSGHQLLMRNFLALRQSFSTMLDTPRRSLEKKGMTEEPIWCR